MGKESILDIAKRIKENKLLKEKQEIDIDSIFLKGYPKKKSYDPQILITKKAPSFYTDEDKKKFVSPYKCKISICYNKDNYDIRVIIYHKVGAVEYDETFSIKSTSINKLYKSYVNDIYDKNIIKEKIGNFVSDSLDETYQNEFLKTKNKNIKKIMEICDAVVEVLNSLECNEVVVGEECF